MGHILFYITVLCVLTYYPEVFLLAGLILAGFYLHGKYELTERDSKAAEGSFSEEDFVDPMAKAEKEVESKMKEGFRDDPKWQAASKKVNDHTDIMRNISDLEMEIEDLEEERAKKSGPEVDFDLAEAQKYLKTLENQAGITQRRQETAKEKAEPPPKAQTPHKDMTDQEIDDALQQLNDL